MAPVFPFIPDYIYEQSGTQEPYTDLRRFRDRGQQQTPQGGSGVSRSFKNDPTYMAFLRQMGLDETMINDTLQSIILAGAQASARDVTFFEDQRMTREKSISESAEERGMFRSGRRISDVARGRSEIDLQETDAAQERATQLADAQKNAANELAQLEIDRGEAELAARDRAAQYNA
jgi:hypothetical protein